MKREKKNWAKNGFLPNTSAESKRAMAIEKPRLGAYAKGKINSTEQSKVSGQPK